MIKAADLGWCFARATYNDFGKMTRLEIVSPPDDKRPVDFIAIASDSGIQKLRELLEIQI